MNNDPQQFRDTALVGISRSKIRELSQFDSKLHSVPTKFDERAAAFISKLATAEIEKDLEATFQRLRKTFRLKRVEAQVSTPEPGWGLIETPHFVYCLHANMDADDPTLVCWERSVGKIADPQQIGSPEFAEIFDLMFDRIEFCFEQPIEMADWIDMIEDQDDERLELNYDSNLQNCTLQIDGMAATIHINESKFAVVHPQSAPTQQILSSYWQARETVAHATTSR